MKRCMILLPAGVFTLAFAVGMEAAAAVNQPPKGFTALFNGKVRSSGYFGLAGHNDPVMFRNIAIKRLK